MSDDVRRYSYEYCPANDAYEIAPVGPDGELDWDNEVCITASNDEAMAKRIVDGLNRNAALTARLEALKTAPQIASGVSRCMCPFTPGYLVKGWKPDMKLGTDDNHKSYCPFGIAKAITDFIERTEHAYDQKERKP